MDDNIIPSSENCCSKWNNIYKTFNLIPGLQSPSHNTVATVVVPNVWVMLSHFSSVPGHRLRPSLTDVYWTPSTVLGAQWWTHWRGLWPHRACPTQRLMSIGQLWFSPFCWWERRDTTEAGHLVTWCSSCALSLSPRMLISWQQVGCESTVEWAVLFPNQKSGVHFKSIHVHGW